MNTPVPQPALREWRTHMTLPARMAGLAGAAVILTLIAPFDTDSIENALPRFGYWLTLVVLTYSVGFFANNWAVRLTPAPIHLIARIALGAILTSVGVFAVIYVLNGLALDFWPRGAILLEAIFNVAVIASIISAVFHLISDDDEMANTDSGPTPPALLDRLPFNKRGPLVSLSVEDHYVRIRTTNGEDMVLMRLADAIREASGVPGAQIHRSHWAALEQIAQVTRKGDGAILTMTHGPDIPVSRANMAKIKEAGLLPKSNG